MLWQMHAHLPSGALTLGSPSQQWPPSLCLAPQAKRWCRECDAAGDLGISISVERWAPRKRAQQAQQGGSRGDGEGDEGTDSDDEQREQEQDQEQQRAASRKPISLLFYLANEDLSPLEFHPQALAAALTAGSQPQRVAGGAVEPIGDWSLYLSASSGDSQSSSGSGGDATRGNAPSKANKLQANFLAVTTPHFHNLTELARRGLYHGMVLQHRAGEARLRPVLPNKAQPGANLVLLQVTTKLPIRLDLALVASRAGAGAGSSRGSSSGGSGSTASSGGGKAGAGVGAGAEGESARVTEVTGRQLDALLAQRGAEFGARFEETFGRVAAKQLPSGEWHFSFYEAWGQVTPAANFTHACLQGMELRSGKEPVRQGACLGKGSASASGVWGGAQRACPARRSGHQASLAQLNMVPRSQQQGLACEAHTCQPPCTDELQTRAVLCRGGGCGSRCPQQHARRPGILVWTLVGAGARQANC